ncbi:scavenger receptor class B member 1-like [Hetaerina americana]|uniref:scavenger receptor class B member 1-like n=1 Tax=Hetaerina americana TaxID=62018 RepID=UPI003A7F1887
MGLHKQYLKVGQSARNKLFGVSPFRSAASKGSGEGASIQMLISEPKKFFHGRLTLIIVGVISLIIGIVLAYFPWLDYIILKNLRLRNGTLGFHYWQKPGVIRLTKLYIFNVTNPDGFLNNSEKPKLNEIGPFVYREDMEKVNIAFHENNTVTFQHKKILHFVPELSAGGRDTTVTVPNIPLLTLSTQSKELPRIVRMGLSLMLRSMKMEPFVRVTPEQLAFGYDDTLLTLAYRFFPRHRRPMSKMGLLIGRNGTINDVTTIFTGHSSMSEFGLMNRLNGLDRLPMWDRHPCDSLRASEGSFFPPRHFTQEDVVNVWDKDLCRVLPLQFRGTGAKEGISVGHYTPPDDVFADPSVRPENGCFCPGENGECPPSGLQNIAPCQYEAPVYLSFPHFYQADPKLLEAVEGLKPDQKKHETFFKIQPKLGVPLEAQVRVQMNLKVEKVTGIQAVAKFPDIVFPIIWVEEGVAHLTNEIHWWIYLATTFSDIAAPLVIYGIIAVGSLFLLAALAGAYREVVFTPENIERGKETLRRGSSFIVNGQHRLLILRDSYSLLENRPQNSPANANSDAASSDLDPEA